MQYSTLISGGLCCNEMILLATMSKVSRANSIQIFLTTPRHWKLKDISSFCLQDEDAIDKDGNDYEGEGSRPQKHAKSPELARDFLLDAATVIFKEQVVRSFNNIFMVDVPNVSLRVDALI